MTTPFDQAVTRHGPTVLRVCRAVLGPGPDADDAWSETFLSLLRAWPDLADGTNVEAWLVRVAHRRAVDVVRRRARQAVPTDTVPEQVSDLGVPGHRDDGLWDAVASLPDRQRLAVAYHFLGGLTHAETAVLIGGRADAVRRASADGVRTLRRIYTTQKESPDDH
ncbi:sigma-70 family RNA polymerase sigma factor [Corynebacterium sp.]|jgi:RNA polymerase sigma factor (sigma-70 family)|uniref:RNA polymerase sigma factor n=1 Tax=Corynebacterium sp. TaxID=1720 RepID=UPI0025BD834F|nr:sigma-70 family RNA polymerase sigma factor [Corynebacterium sp.]